MEEIENQIRNLFDEHFLLEEIKTACIDSNKKIETIDDMTFGEYIKIMEIPENWDKLEIESDRRLFIQRLDEIRQIRNDIMHFEPAGITEDQYQKLQLTSRYLDKITKYRRYKTYSDKS